MTADLVAFLRARLDDAVTGAGQWHDLECDIHAHLAGGLVASVAASRMLAEVPGAVCDCGGPTRVLAEVDAKRRTLIRCEEAMLTANPMLVHFAKQTVREMALPYADHPDYRDEWRR